MAPPSGASAIELEGLALLVGFRFTPHDFICVLFCLRAIALILLRWRGR